MHRSGTTLLTKLLNKIGVFMGNRVEPNSESILFLKINEQLLKKGKAAWYNPLPFLSSVDNNLSDYAQYANNIIEKCFTKKYSNNNFLKHYNKRFKWGWKDPRNIITIKVWKELFPQAKIINIFRNPIDVANSLRARELIFTKKGALWWYYKTAYNYYKFGLHVKRCPPLLDINNGIKLWKEYIDESLKNNDNLLNIKYEDFIDNPTNILQTLVNFLEIKCDNNRMNEAISIINTKRKYAFINDSDLVQLYNEIKNYPLIVKTGYNNILNDI